MIEIIAFIIISFIIIIFVEFFTYTRKKKPTGLYTNKNVPKNFKTEESYSNILDKYSTSSDIEIEHLPGKFFVNNNNIFIKINDRVIIPELDVVYNISESFTLEIINMTGGEINYYYKKNI